MNDRRVAELLAGSSRTFALALPLLPEPARREASLAYLLFRVADTLEDATHWSARQRITALEGLAEFLGTADPARGISPRRLELRACSLAADWLHEPPCPEPGYLELLREFPQVIRALGALDPGPRRLVLTHARRSGEGMRAFALRDHGAGLVIATTAELREYCYVVAGVVGELLTELFLRRMPGVSAAGALLLRDSASAFGEGLQLVNILRDERADHGTGRRLIPPGQHLRLFRRAGRDLRVASSYVARLRSEGAPEGVTRFTSFLVRLAAGTLAVVLSDGPGAKLSRTQVADALEASGLPA